MKKKRLRIWAVLLIVTMLIGLFPTASMAADPGEVTYVRKEPEASILNRYTGSSAKFYETLISNSSRFNAIDLFTIKTADIYGNLSGDEPAFCTDIIAYKTLVYDNFAGSVLNELSFVRDNLQANVSGTFHNHFHKHTVGRLAYDLISFSKLDFYIKGNYTNQNLYGKSRPTETNPRLGNMEFSTVNSVDYRKYYNGDGSPLIGGILNYDAKYGYTKDMRLNLTGGFSFYDKGKKVCACQGHYVTNIVVAFKDEKAPKLEVVKFSGDARGNGYYKAGDTIKIEAIYDEYIRFADDSNKHDDLFIKLQVEGVDPSRYPKAYLKELNTDRLYFEYEVPEDEGKLQKITGVDLSPLMGENIPLKQVYRHIDFTVDVPSDVGGKTTGFTTTTAYITDLAGNAITDKTAIPSAYIDTREMVIDKIDVSFIANNQEVKDALGKTNPDDKDYLDKSDNYMGVGDSILISLTTNKSAGINDQNYYGLEATTNWKDKDDNFCKIKSQRVSSTKADSGEQVNCFTFEQFTILPDMYCADGDNAPLKITSINFVDPYIPFSDLAGKQFNVNNFNGDDIPMQKCYIDTQVPGITSEASSSGQGNDKVYMVTPISTNDREGTFRFQFKATDVSGVELLKGGFSWYNKDAASAYEYLVKAVPSLEGNEKWESGYMGVFYEFTQTGADQYLFIRPKLGEKYDICDTELLFYAKDYAGNNHLQDGENPVGFKIGVVWDDVAPTAKAGNVKRTANVSGGWTLAVDVLLEDHTALDNNSVQYGWIDQEPSDPVTVENIGDVDWKSATLTFDPGTLQSGTAKATTIVHSGERFSKHLVVRVKDTSGNESVTYLGKYEYDLTAIPYTLDYSSGITGLASLKVLSIGSGDGENYSGGTLLFMIPIPDKVNEYFVSYCQLTKDVLAKYASEGFPDYPGDPREVFTTGSIDIGTQDEENGKAMGWQHMTVDKNGGLYEFTMHIMSGKLEEYLQTFLEDYTFCGSLPVTVLAGQNDAFDMTHDDNSDQYYPVTANGVAVEEILLRMSGPNAPSEDVFKGMSITTDDTIDTKYTSSFWNKSDKDKPMLSSAEGVAFQINLGTDVNGWNFEDVDYANSYVELLHETSSESYIVPLSYSPIQTVVFPKDDYLTGFYDVKLVVICKAGRDHVLTLGEKMYIDSTPAVQSFGITSLTYEETNYQDKGPCHDVTGSVNYFTDSDIIYLPVHASTGADIDNKMKVEVEKTSGSALKLTYAVRAWNATAGVTAEEAAYSITGGQDNERFFMFTVWDTPEAAKAEMGTSTSASKTYSNIGLIRNTPNTIAVQVLNANGKESSIRYYVIYPMDKELEGSLSATLGEDGSNVVSDGDVIFTPAKGQSMEGTGLYVSVGYYESGKFKQKTDFLRQEMLPQADGSYTYPLLSGKEGSGHYVYSVYAIDSYGNLSILGEIDTALVDHEAPLITKISSSTGDGLYEVKFKLEDDTLYAANLKEATWTSLYKPMAISLRFNKEHAEWLGIHENTSLDLTLNEDDKEFVWTAGESSETGIYEVRAVRNKAGGAEAWDTPYWLEITVKGVVGYREVKTLEDFKLIMDASDALGNKTKAIEFDAAGDPYEDEASTINPSGFAEIDNPSLVKPEAITSGTGAPEYVATGTYDKALKLTFNFPVLPEASWICPEPEYGRVQTDAFPITNDGTWTITYSDIFGKVYEQELTLKDVFKEYGIALSINPTELTNDKVDLLVRTIDEDADDSLLIFRKTESGGMVPISNNGDSNTPMQEKSMEIEENQTLIIMHYLDKYNDSNPFTEGDYTHGDRLEVKISNIAKEAPAAEPHFYFEANGTEYTLDTIPKNDTTSGNVLVWYSTSRNVIPTDGTKSSHTFKYGEGASYTFKYEDDFGYPGSLTVDLQALGITLTEPGKPDPDKTAPHVTVALNAKRFGTYREEESFGYYTTPSAITAAFNAVNYVQGYLLVVDVYDQSSYEIVIKKNKPDSITYATATSDIITGVSLAGNTITINKAKGETLEDFTIVVVDNAKMESEAPKDNFTCIELKAADMADWFDNTIPKATTAEKWNTLYNKTIYIQLSDKADNDVDTSPVTLDSPKLDVETTKPGYVGWYKRVFTMNGSDYLIFYDIAGNMGTKQIDVGNIDGTKPSLTTIWSPYYINPEDSSETKPESPPAGPLNTNVSAVITSSTKIEGVTAEYTSDGGITWGATPMGQVSYTYTTDQVFVTFTGDGCGIRLTVTAPNGKTAKEDLFLASGVIDKNDPSINFRVDYQYRTNSEGAQYSVPYSAVITLKPDKKAYCLNAGKPDTLYDSANPLKITTYNNETKTYKFVNQAGNQSEVKVDITTLIDNTPPTFAVDPENTFHLAWTSGTVDVKITSNEAGTAKCQGKTYDLNAGTATTISFTENGVYIIVVYDKAGNSDSVSFVVGNIDKVLPTISFDKLTLSIRQNTLSDALTALLNAGVNVWDNLDASTDLIWAYEDAGIAVNLTLPGLYPVTYTVEDKAGNVGEGIRYVRVMDENLPVIIIDGGTPKEQLTEAEGTTVLSPGKHKLSVEGLKEIALGVEEPYTLKIRRGMVTEGQMKYYPSTVSVAADGTFTIYQEGFYTMHIITQSRQSYRTLLYVER